MISSLWKFHVCFKFYFDQFLLGANWKLETGIIEFYIHFIVITVHFGARNYLLVSKEKLPE